MLLDLHFTLNYSVDSDVLKHDILVSGINFYDQYKSATTVEDIMQREGEIYQFDIFPRWVTANSIELVPYAGDGTHFIKPSVMSSTLIEEALTNIQDESSIVLNAGGNFTAEDGTTTDNNTGNTY